jgi:hypothetical protein
MSKVLLFLKDHRETEYPELQNLDSMIARLGVDFHSEERLGSANDP